MINPVEFKHNFTEQITFEKWQWVLQAKNIKGFLDWTYKPFFNMRKSNGELTELDTDELNFSLQHPVEMLPQQSYDGSINLILNDNNNPPRLINSRFTVRENNTYERVDRKGENDTNLYDVGKFKLQTSLQKLYTTIPKIQFNGESMLGHLKVGTYVFYFAYCDADGNETDIVAESSVVSIFKGSTPFDIEGGISDQDSLKSVSFTLKNIDSEYGYIKVYYVRNSAAIDQTSVSNAYKLIQKYSVRNGICDILITGLESYLEVPISDLNIQYTNINSAKTQAVTQNRLFIGNVKRVDPMHQDLQDISLHILPTYQKYKRNEKIGEVNYSYTDYTILQNNLEYYNPNNIYNYTGYAPNEIYRIGIVYILKDNSLSPVYNIRGRKNIPEFSSNFEEIENEYTKFDVYNKKNKKRKFISEIDETTNEFIGGKTLENSMGVIYIEDNDEQEIYSLKFCISNEAFNYLKSIVKGYFFVRQKRMQLKLGQALMLPVDKESSLPIIPNSSETGFIESFMDKDLLITNDYRSRLFELPISNNKKAGALIFPEYEINQPYFNTLFTGAEFTIKYPKYNNINNYLSQDSLNERHYYPTMGTNNKDSLPFKVKLIQVSDNMKLSGIDDFKFRARAGEAEEGFRYEKIYTSTESKDAHNYARGCFGPYVGVAAKQVLDYGKIIDVYVPGYNEFEFKSYFKIRYQDQSEYYAISDRYNFTNIHDFNTDIYRGDSYICNFTHRLNRNFADPELPNNDKIIDEKTWKNNFKVSDGVVNKEQFSKINLGDLNAVKLGSWITIKVRCSRNLSIRSKDTSNLAETTLFGHSRGFYPIYPMSADASYKIPDSQVYNNALTVSTGAKSYFTLPDAPYFKDTYQTRIYYSDMHITDAYINGYRRFLSKCYRDYETKYGGIVKIVPYDRNLICVFEHGITLLAINQQTPISSKIEEPVFINSNNVLPEVMTVISDTIGSQWPDSILKTNTCVYGVDTHAKKIWKVGPRGFESLTDFKLPQFINNNITLTENETNVYLGIRNIKTHFNKNKGDVIFTYYDNVYDYEEVAWSLCYNEKLDKWITFYSWIPSFSENLYNNYFSFDRNISKYISKLGASCNNSIDSYGIVVDNCIFDKSSQEIHLSLKDFKIDNDKISITKTFVIDKDIYGFYEYFTLEKNVLKVKNEKFEENVKKIKSIMEHHSLPVVLLNIQCKIKVDYIAETFEDYKNSIDGYIQLNAKLFKKTVALTTEEIFNAKRNDEIENKLNLANWFWSHGKTGIFNIKDPIAPTKWYGKQHPFEFEFIVNKNIETHKIFDNLYIISNYAEPESFHYEIIGDCFDFADDKQNMYVRQEATKKLYQENGLDITYDHIQLPTEHRKLTSEKFDKSTILPLYYYRRKGINTIEDYYHLKDDIPSKNFSNMSGGEIVRNTRDNTFSIWNHCKAVNFDNDRLRGNMQYKEDKWYVQINPINIVQSNEDDWKRGTLYSSGKSDKVPIEINTSIKPTYLKEITIPTSYDRSITQWISYIQSQCKLKDKYIKIRIRYSGEQLAIIHSIYTLFSTSYA